MVPVRGIGQLKGSLGGQAAALAGNTSQFDKSDEHTARLRSSKIDSRGTGWPKPRQCCHVSFVWRI